jgi:putative transposase
MVCAREESKPSCSTGMESRGKKAMPKQASRVKLSEKEQEELTQMLRRHRSEQQLVLRARIVLKASQGQTNAQIARELAINVDTVRLWRDRWAGGQEFEEEPLSVTQRLQDAPRPGAVPKFTSEQRCQMAALACEVPSQSGRPISQWTGREIADEMKKRGIVTEISPRHAARLLKKGASGPIASAIGSPKRQTRSEKRKSGKVARSMLRPRNELNGANGPSAWMN